MEELEYFFLCPYCHQNISMILDLSAGSQGYAEDCEICCRPIHLSFTVSDGVISQFDARGDDW